MPWEVNNLAKAAKVKARVPSIAIAIICGEYGYRTADCPQPRNNRNVGMEAEQQQQHPFNPYSQQQNQQYRPYSNQYCAFMLTTAQDTHVDCRGGWNNAGKGNKTNLSKASPNPTIEVGNKSTELA